MNKDTNQTVRILIVDTQANLRGFARFGIDGFLNKNKLLTATLNEASSAQEARALIAKNNYDVVITAPDLETPQAGVELVRDIRSNPALNATAILGFSKEVENEQLMRAAGANDYIWIDYSMGINPLAHMSKVLQKLVVEKDAGFVQGLALEHTMVQQTPPGVAADPEKTQPGRGAIR